jgi:DNA polymerase
MSAVPAAARHARACIAHETDFEGFRREARRLLADGTPPACVHWAVEAGRGDAADLFAAAEPVPEGRAEATAAWPHAAAGAAPLRVPAAFLQTCREVLLHADPGRFALLYRLLWRFAHEPGLAHDALDAEMARAARMAQAVRRDIHKMRAFVRFREVAEPGEATPLHVAWFEPEHHIVDTNAPFFQRRFAGMRWAILTPERSVRWDGRTLAFGPGARRAEAPPPDAGEALWLTYYAHIFNPARLKLAAMENEMPRRYWKNLPEAALIAPLAAGAPRREVQMVEQAPTSPRRRIVPIRRTAADAEWAAPAIAAPGAPHAAASLADRARAASACRECPLGALATQTVWGEGPVGASLMLVGEQPGDREDLEGRPFVGPAGALLDRALAELGWPRSLLYVTNAVKHFKHEPRGRRRIHKTPAQREADACLHWLEAEIEAVSPRAIVALGATAARQLLGRPVPVLAERGRWQERADGLPVLVTLHPAALLRGDPAALDTGFAAWVNDLRAAAEVAVTSPEV